MITRSGCAHCDCSRVGRKPDDDEAMTTSGARMRIDVLEQPDLQVLALGRGFMDEVSFAPPSPRDRS